MIDIYKERNLFKLWFASFNVSNKMIVPFFKIFLVAIIAGIGSFFFSFFLGDTFASLAISTALKLVASVASCWGCCALVRLCAAHVEGRMETVSQAFSSSFLPFVYLVVLILLLSIVLVPIAILFPALAVIFSSAFLTLFSSGIGALLLLLALLLIPLFFVVRLFYVPAAIILKEKGPFSAIQYSWELTQGMGMLYAFGAFVLMSLLFHLFTILIVLAYEFIPLYAPSLNLAGLPTPVLVSLLLVILCLFFFFQACGYVFYTLVFMHIDGENSSAQWATTPDMHIVNKRKSDVQMTTDDAEITFHEEETIRLNADKIQELTVESTAVKTETSNKNLKDELKKVYKPQPIDKLVQSGDEDRMPTILFDDETAKNLEESKKMFTAQPPQETKDKPDDDNGEITSIKISKL